MQSIGAGGVLMGASHTLVNPVSGFENEHSLMDLDYLADDYRNEVKIRSGIPIMPTMCLILYIIEE